VEQVFGSPYTCSCGHHYKVVSKRSGPVSDVRTAIDFCRHISLTSRTACCSGRRNRSSTERTWLHCSVHSCRLHVRTIRVCTTIHTRRFYRATLCMRGIAVVRCLSFRPLFLGLLGWYPHHFSYLTLHMVTKF